MYRRKPIPLNGNAVLWWRGRGQTLPPAKKIEVKTRYCKRRGLCTQTVGIFKDAMRCDASQRPVIYITIVLGLRVKGDLAWVPHSLLFRSTSILLRCELALPCLALACSSKVDMTMASSWHEEIGAPPRPAFGADQVISTPLASTLISITCAGLKVEKWDLEMVGGKWKLGK